MDAAHGSPYTSPFLGTTLYPCCVPYWDQQAFFAAGGEYSKELGYVVSTDAYLAAVDEWLPRKWQYRGDPPVPTLLPDMLPSSTWESNLRHVLSDAEWDRLRKFCYSAAGNTCIACGSRGEPQVEAHEAWKFNEETGVQKLVGLLCLCPTCHKCKHIGFSRRLGMYPQVLARLQWLNNWSMSALEENLAQMQTRQEALSLRSWELDLSFLHKYGVR